MSEIELKLCPFCGGEAYINYESMVNERRIYWAQILCKKCHCRSVGNWNNSYENAEKKEIKEWNTRKPMERIEEQLEKSKGYSVSPQFTKGIDRAIEIVQKGGAE